MMHNEEYTTTIYITELLTKENKIYSDEKVALGISTDSKILFNPYNYVKVISIDPETGEMYKKSRPAYIGLAHELVHADRIMRGVALSENVNKEELDRRVHHSEKEDKYNETEKNQYDLDRFFCGVYRLFNCIGCFVFSSLCSAF